MAPDAEQDRHIMTKTSRKRRHFPVPMRWFHAGNDPSRPSHRGQPTLSSLISSRHLPRRLSHAYDLASVQICRPHSAATTSTIELGVGIKSP
jgi:hypothetical protein